MMLSLSEKNFRKTGIILMMAGLLFLVLAVAISIFSVSRRAEGRKAVKLSADVCAKNIQAIGLDASASENEITVKKADLKNALLILSQSSVAINSCPGWILSSYCMGVSCEGHGMQFTLKRVR